MGDRTECTVKEVSAMNRRVREQVPEGGQRKSMVAGGETENQGNFEPYSEMNGTYKSVSTRYLQMKLLIVLEGDW